MWEILDDSGPLLPNDELDWVTPDTLEQPLQPRPTVWGHDAEPQARHTEFGTNVTHYTGAGAKDTLIFINQIKAATPFVGLGGSTSDLTFDANGYVTEMPDGMSARAEVLRRSSELQGLEPFTGTFRLYGLGDGRISLGDGYTNNILNRTMTGDLPTEMIDGVEYWYADIQYTGQEKGGRDQLVTLYISKLNADDHVRDLALVHHTHLEAYRDGAVFAPEFLADMDRYDSLRFMDWMHTNTLDIAPDNSALDPERRYIGTEHFTYNTVAGGSSRSMPSSMPIEHIVALSNAVQADAWIALPADITDARARSMAQYVRDNLDPDLQVFWEYGNEVWNGARGFDSHAYAQHMARATFDGFTGAGTHAAVEWTAFRAPQVYALIKDVFDATGDSARYVAPGWAYDAPVRAQGGAEWSAYNFSLFEAREARKLDPDVLRLGDIATDYAIGLYHTNVPSGSAGDLGSALVAQYATTEMRAEALARWMLFGMNPDMFHDIGRDALDAPATVAWQDGLNIAVSRLVRGDVEAGLDPLNDLDQVIRLQGAELQYRGRHATDWTTVLQFDTVPDKTLAELIADVELIGESFRYYGEVKVGVMGGLLANTEIRLARHVAFVEDLGLNFVAYEGGTHMYQPRGVDVAAMFEAYEKSGWASVVQNVWFDQLELASVDLFMNYMSHDRTVGANDYWGAQDYTGQALEDTPKGAHLIATIAAGPAPEPDGFDPVAAMDAPVLDPGLTWTIPTNWTIAADGTMTETEGRNSPLTGKMLRPGTDLDAQTLSFDVEVSGHSRPGKIFVEVIAPGPERLVLARWEDWALDVNGQRVEIALDTIPENYQDLTIVVRRTWAPAGILEISNFTLEGPVPEDLPESVPTVTGRDLATESWRSGDNWTVTETGVLVETGRHWEPVHAEIDLGAARGTAQSLWLEVAASATAPGDLRIFVQAFGSGLTQLVDVVQTVQDGDQLRIDLGEIPAQHDQLRVVIRRAGSQQGDLTIDGLMLMPTQPDPVDLAVSDMVATTPQTEAPQTEAPDTSSADTSPEPSGTSTAPQADGDGADTSPADIHADTTALVPGVEPAPDMAPDSAPDSAPEDAAVAEADVSGDPALPVMRDLMDAAWRLNANWVQEPDGRFTEMGHHHGTLSTEIDLGAARGTAQSLWLDVAADAAAPGKLRVFVQAFGSGLTQLVDVVIGVRDGDRLQIDLGTIPAHHDQLRVVIRRAGPQQGNLTLDQIALLETPRASVQAVA